MKNLILFCVSIALVGGMLILQSCKPSKAVVDCNTIEKFESRSGVLNVNGFKLGDVVMLNTTAKTANFLLDVHNPTISNASAKIDTMTLLTSTDFSVTFSGDITSSAALQVQAKTYISNNSMFSITNSFRKNLVNALNDINGDQPSKATIKASSKANIVFMVVSAIMYGDSFQFQLRKQVGVGASASATFGKYTLDVQYGCQGGINIKAATGGIFYKPLFFVLDANDQAVAYTATVIDLKEYNMNYGLR
ncbi:MAG: hypothetical protein QM734_14400 [Cyclobacteriaceae bacterium]